MSLAPRLDWVLKLMAIERAMEQSPNLSWDSPQIKVIDHLYSSLDDDGLFRAYEASGFTEQLVTPERIAHFSTNPPSDTRAWTRTMLLRRAIEDRVEVNTVDWDRITFRIKGRHNWPSYRTIAIADPLGFTQAHAESSTNVLTSMTCSTDWNRCPSATPLSTTQSQSTKQRREPQCAFFND
jgi:hypothetical protein